MKLLELTMKRRARLLERFKEQHRSVHPDRNITAGKLYENTREMEAECERILDREYAEKWVDRWPV